MILAKNWCIQRYESGNFIGNCPWWLPPKPEGKEYLQQEIFYRYFVLYFMLRGSCFRNSGYFAQSSESQKYSGNHSM